MAGSGYDNNNKGTISKNDKKTEPKHKDYSGSAVIDGQEYWISGWIKDGRNGKFLSLAFDLKDKNKASSSSRASNQEESSDDEMPF
jgi:hypothetical protein